MNALRLIWRTTRRLVVELCTDNTTGLAAQLAYQFIFLFAPGLLFLWQMLGLFGTDPAKLHRLFTIIKSFLPPDPRLQDVLDIALANVVVSGSSGILGNAALILGIYFGTNFISTISRALTQTHGVHSARNWWSNYVVSFLLLFWFVITILISFNVIVFGESLAGIAEVNFQLAIPLQEWVAALSLPFTGVALIILALGLYLLTPEKYFTTWQALPGAVLFAAGWLIVTKLFQLYVTKYDRYNPTYHALASIIILLTWMYLTCFLLLVGGKLNAILQREREPRTPAPEPSAPLNA